MSEDPWDDWETAADAGVRTCSGKYVSIIDIHAIIVNWLWYTQSKKNIHHYYYYIK